MGIIHVYRKKIEIWRKLFCCTGYSYFAYLFLSVWTKRSWSEKKRTAAWPFRGWSNFAKSKYWTLFKFLWNEFLKYVAYRKTTWKKQILSPFKLLWNKFLKYVVFKKTAWTLLSFCGMSSSNMLHIEKPVLKEMWKPFYR